MSSSKADHEARRAARLAAALRENLKKRKEQTRARDEVILPPHPDKAQDEVA